MLVLKFCKNDDLNRHVEVSLSCETVEVVHLSNGGYLVIAYKTLIHQESVEYRVDKEHYYVCFVINETGKTVDKYYYTDLTTKTEEAS